MALALSVVALLSLSKIGGFSSLTDSMQIINFELIDAFTSTNGQALGVIELFPYSAGDSVILGNHIY